MTYKPKTTDELMAEARAKFQKDYPNAQASDLAAVSRVGKSLEQRAALNKLTLERRGSEKAAALAGQMKDRYAKWQAAGFPVTDVVDLGLAVGLTING